MVTYTCSECGAVHALSLFIRVRLVIGVRHVCPNCNAVHLLKGSEVHRVQPRNANALHMLLPLCAEVAVITHLSMWYSPDTVPPTAGIYECRFNAHRTLLPLEWDGAQWHVPGSLIVCDVSAMEAWRGKVVV